MKLLKLITLPLLLALLALTSCSEDDKTTLIYSYTCVSELLDYVDISATYGNDNGFETTEQLSLTKTDTIPFTYSWLAIKSFGYKTEGHLTITFTKREDVDWQALKNQYFGNLSVAKINIMYTSDKDKFFNKEQTIGNSACLDISNYVGRDIESYVDSLVANPIQIKTDWTKSK